MAAIDGDVAVGDERSALSLATESECLQLTDDFEREGIVELQHVDVVAPQPGLLEGAVGRASADDAVDVPAVLPSSPGEIPRRWMLVGRAVEVRAAAQNVYGLGGGI